jgi:DNA polymerase I
MQVTGGDLELLALPLEVSVDTETTGLYPFKDDELFSIIFGTEKGEHYINCQPYVGEEVEFYQRHRLQALKPLFDDPARVWFLQNAKFDMHHLAREGLLIKGRIYDLAVLDRLHFNQHTHYNLAAISARWGDEKLDVVWKYIQENKLIEKVQCPETGRAIDKPQFAKVPFELMREYACQDAKATLAVGKKILSTLTQGDTQQPGLPAQSQVIDMESRLTHTLFHMEQTGIQLDVEFCREALNYYRLTTNGVEYRFKELTGEEFVKGTLVFEKVFESEKDKWVKTEKGNWRWDHDTLATFENPAARVVQEYAEAKKMAEYFENFLFFMDSKGVIHPSFLQSGTVTGRLACREPNLQNLTSSDKYDKSSVAEKFPVRKAFIPRPGYFFFAPDYSQVEFRLFLDLARANSLISEILKGHDVHTATASVAGVSRKEAKTVNFLTVYGGGVVKLAQNLFEPKGSRLQLSAIYKNMFKWRKTLEEQMAWDTQVTPQMVAYNEPIIRQAYEVQQAIFRAAPEIKDTMKAIQSRAETRGFVCSWLGRRYQFPEKKWCYKAPNHVVQGGAAEVIKLAMNRVDEYLTGRKSRMILTIHDELIIEVAYGEEYVIPEIQGIMESVYPHKRLPLAVECEYAAKNLADKQSEIPCT